MKQFIYKSPVLSASLINIVGTLFIIYSMSNYNSITVVISLFIGTLNRKIISNGIDMNKQKKMIISISFFLMVGILLWYSIYLRNIRNSNIVN